MSMKLVAAMTLIALMVPAFAQAQLDCIVSTREEGFDQKQPGATELQRAARAVAAIVHKNTVFMQGNKPVRIRTTIDYGGWDRQSASVVTTAYNQKAWLAGGCKVSKFADRGGGLSDGTIAIFINEPEAMFGGHLGDAELKASGMPMPLGNTAGFPIYAGGGNKDNPRLLMSRAGYEPWVPVTIADMLDWRERELKKKEHEYQASVQRNGNGLTEAKIEEIYHDMKKINAEEAEKMRTQMLASLKTMRAKSARQSVQAAQWMTQERQAFDAYRASFTRAQLAMPGTISNSMTRDKVIRVDDPEGKRLAKVDPAYAQRDPRHIHLIVVGLSPQPKTDPNYAWFKASLEALGYAALAKLLSE
jgi:RNA-binding protein YhbY